jgi:hypothetical protein
MTEDDSLIELSWDSVSLLDDSEPDKWVYSYCGDILNIEEDDSRTKIGKFSAQYIDVGGAMNEGEPIFEILDCHSSSLAEYFEPIFGDNAPNFSDTVEQITKGNADGCNLLIIDRVEIIAEYRGKGIGLRILSHMMVRFSMGAGIVALKAFPLQFELEQTNEDQTWHKLLSLESFENNVEVSTTKLKDYYSRLGFKCLPAGDFMVFPTGEEIPWLFEK